MSSGFAKQNPTKSLHRGDTNSANITSLNVLLRHILFALLSTSPLARRKGGSCDRWRLIFSSSISFDPRMAASNIAHVGKPSRHLRHLATFGPLGWLILFMLISTVSPIQQPIV